MNTNYNNKEGRIELPFKNNKNNNNDDSDKYSSSTSTVDQRAISSCSTQLFRRFLRTSKNDFQEDSTSRIRADTVISTQAIIWTMWFIVLRYASYITFIYYVLYICKKKIRPFFKTKLNYK